MRLIGLDFHDNGSRHSSYLLANFEHQGEGLIALYFEDSDHLAILDPGALSYGNVFARVQLDSMGAEVAHTGSASRRADAYDGIIGMMKQAIRAQMEIQDIRQQLNIMARN